MGITVPPVSISLAAAMGPAGSGRRVLHIEPSDQVIADMTARLGASDPIAFKLGSAHVSVGAGSTLSVDVHEMISAMTTAEAIAAGEQQLRLVNGGKTEPQQ